MVAAAIQNGRPVGRPSTVLGGTYPEARPPDERPEERIRRVAALYGWGPFDHPDLPTFRRDPRARRTAVRRMLSDEAVKGGILEKVFGVGQLTLQVKPANKDNPLAVQAAEFVRFNIEDRLPYGVPGLVEAIGLHALLEDHSLCEPVWPAVGVLETDDPWRGKRPLADVKARHPDGYRLRHDNYGTITAVEYMGGDGGLQYGDPASFIIFSYIRLWSQTLSGYSDVEGAYNHFLSKINAVRMRQMFEDRVSGGFLKITGDPTSATLKADAAAARGMGYIILAPGSDAEVLDLAGSSFEVFSKGIEDRNKAILFNFGGAYLHAMESSSGNRRGNAQVGMTVSELRQWHFASAISAVLTRQLAPIILAENLPAAPKPKLILSATDEAYVKQRLENALIVKELVGPENMSMEQMYEISGFNPPRTAADQLPPAALDPFAGLPSATTGVEGSPPE